MVSLQQEMLRFSFPEVHSAAVCDVRFCRTLRVPDDNNAYPLPPALGVFPLRAVDDVADRLPEAWHIHGGVFVPMYQSEALWMRFLPQPEVVEPPPYVPPPSPMFDVFASWGIDAKEIEELREIWSPKAADERLERLERRALRALRRSQSRVSVPYPFAIKVATGKINAISGLPWQMELCSDPQDYLVVPNQPWFDGYNVAKGLVRQFVATPFGSGHSVEQQLTGAVEHGGLQIAVYPMKADVYAAYREQYLRKGKLRSMAAVTEEMELSVGGLIRQDIYQDPFGIDAWDQGQVQRCFVHLLNSEQYQAVTGERSPRAPFRAQDYAKAGLPWFHYYSDDPVIGGAAALAKVQSVAAVTATQTGKPMPDNAPLGPLPVEILGEKQVRSGEF
ncbi:hypothetical protein F2Q65_09305 [Thiohalocapsa marina]|uniref:Uncharacterized protein n=1 Tax=Thiohalocapsa marina TaxID=424902 RepID=A0A5M8FNQ0_9GAMM|nr:hypothetical protein [Thiohalocapsa marina]KAA6185286.1 hypothetical protein F2Q65_09305 [Thiohalocapsa marina]